MTTEKKNYCGADGKCKVFCNRNIKWNECDGFTQDLRREKMRCLSIVGNMCGKYLAEKSMKKIVSEIEAAREDGKGGEG